MARFWEITAFGIILIGLTLTILLTGEWFPRFFKGQDDKFAACRNTAIAGVHGDQIGSAFELTAHDGSRFNSETSLSEPSILYFGYTYCPSICPLDMSRNLDVVDILSADGEDLTPIFITVDPERDTVASLSDYAQNMHPRLVALTGTQSEVDKASKAYRTYFKLLKKNESDDQYLVEHSTFSYLVLPEYGFVDFFRRDLPAEAVAEKVACFIEKA